jgi:hypothetical protein
LGTVELAYAFSPGSFLERGPKRPERRSSRNPFARMVAADARAAGITEHHDTVGSATLRFSWLGGKSAVVAAIE